MNTTYRPDPVPIDAPGEPAVRLIPLGGLGEIGLNMMLIECGPDILAALVEAGPAIDEMALMLQQEVALRVAAAPGGKTYGALSVLTQVSARVRLAFSVPPGAFSPPPQVDSAVLHLVPYRMPPVPVADPARFAAVVHAAFSQRRKSLANALAAGLGLGTPRARQLLEAAGIDPGRRAETLALAEFARLAATAG